MEGLLDMLALAQYANDEIPACSGAKFFFLFFSKYLIGIVLWHPDPQNTKKKFKMAAMSF